MLRKTLFDHGTSLSKNGQASTSSYVVGSYCGSYHRTFNA